jgi:hypothetical protein
MGISPKGANQTMFTIQVRAGAQGLLLWASAAAGTLASARVPSMRA